MGQGIHFKIEDVRSAAKQFTADADAFHNDIAPKLSELAVPWTAFPVAIPSLKSTYENVQDATVQLSGSVEKALRSIGDALASVATFYEGVEQKHANEIAKLP